MKHLSALVIFAFVGAACADMKCVNEKSQVCMQSKLKDINPADFTNLKGCEILKKIANCYNDAATECKMTDNKIMKDALDMFEELCKPGSDLNKKLEIHMQCLAETIKEKNIAECPKVLTDAIAKIPQPTKQEDIEGYTLDIANVTCRLMGKIANCVYDVIKAKCGSEADAFVRQVMNPLMDMSKESCKEITNEPEPEPEPEPTTTSTMRCVIENAGLCFGDSGPGGIECEYVQKFTSCFHDIAKQCKMEDDQLMKDLFNMLDGLCKPGSDHEKFKANMECVLSVYRNKYFEEKCLKPVQKDLEDIPVPTTKTPTKEEIEAFKTEAIKTACRHLDQTTDCLYDNINTICGAEVDSFSRNLMKPVLAIAHQTCREVNAGVAQNASAIWLLLQLAAILFCKYIRD